MASKSKSDSTSPDALSIPSGGIGDRTYDIVQKLGSIERSVTYLEGRSSDSDRKIDDLASKIGDLSKEIVEVKAKLTVLQPIAKGIGKALWTIAGGVAIFLLGIVSMWIKHRMGW